MLKNKWFRFSLVLFLIPLILITMTYNQLPAQIATHFGVNGEPNGYMSKFMGLYGTWLFILVLHVFCSFMTLKDPKRENIPNIGIRIVFMICPVICLLLDLVIIGYSLGYKFNVGIVVNVAVGLLFVILGNYLPKVKRNYTFGIRTSWALDDQENWNKTNRIGGYCFVIAGMLYIVLGMFNYMFIGICVIIIACLIPCVYSYKLYKAGL